MGSPTVLLIRFSALGDVILTAPVAKGIRQAHPDAHITFATRTGYAEVIVAIPEVNRTVVLEHGEGVRQLCRRLGRHFDYVIDLQGSIRTRAMRPMIRGRWTQVRKPRRDRILAIWSAVPAPPTHSIIDRYLNAARHLLSPEVDRVPRICVRNEHLIEGESIQGPGLVALAPGASRASKRWPVQAWRSLAELLAEGAWTPVGVGLESDRSAHAAGHMTPAWHLSLMGTLALLSRCRVVVAHDSGLMHAAGAVGTPVVGLFGPTVPELGFRPAGEAEVVEERSLRCRPCSAFGDRDCPAGHHRCLRDIDARNVLAAVHRLA